MMRIDPTDAGPRSTTRASAHDVFVAILHVSKVVQDRLGAELEPALGISPGQVEVLFYLATAPEGRLRMHEIGDRLLVNRTATTRLVDHLESRGLAERLVCEGDRRGVWAAITGHGREMLLRAQPLIDGSLERHVGAFVSQDEMAAVQVVLGKILGGNAIR
jgi:DNA-binding MarR family transcriptional regulator